MRTQASVDLGGGRLINIQELRVRDARNLMAQAKSMEQLDMGELLSHRFDELVTLLSDCIQMPEGETLEDLSFSEVNQVKQALLEVNKDFLDLLGLAAAPVPQETE